MTFKVTRRARSRDAYMGRFGGGWQWHVGVQVGDVSRSRGTVIVSLLTFSVRFAWEAE